MGNVMTSSASLSFDHAHVISPDPQATADWYVDRFGGTVVRSVQIAGAPQIYIAFGGGAMVIVRGERPGEKPAGKPNLQWGLDHFGMRVQGDYDAFCAGLRSKGVKFTMEPTVVNPTTRIAFIEAPDGVSVELLERKD
jgi:catechol 2,3-dioxygenase-like lactoylglutathione lyase family enzyme